MVKFIYLARIQETVPTCMRQKPESWICPIRRNETISFPLNQAGPDKTTESIVQVTVVPETEALAPVMVYFVAPL